ncbi:glucosamine inositolphosphorylceramide transferase family protein [Methylobacterium iners]|uniref:Glucosamine inositolphosphorylceramide transferase 1 N-terminal domain-containing protein n=1 Tax=Methylobacterium iners TaxID=418707 RepID=A0ABQ4RTA2_9HYPH|nr:formyl transferase [Methylobacterium iners]GJD94011.1 hypothetical protein OCOJLMKI_1210 [Methylobacterium iners]
MLLRVRLDGSRPRRWHGLLLDRLAALPGVSVEREASAGPGALPPNAFLLFRLEALLNRLPLTGLAAEAGSDLFQTHPPAGTSPPDIVIDLCGDVPEMPGRRVWRLSYDGRTGEAALLSSLLAGRAPIVAISEAGRVVASGRAGTEALGNILLSFEDALIRTVTLLVAAASGAGPVLPHAEAMPVQGEPARLTVRALGARATRMLAWAILRRLYHLCFRAPHWRVGWRRLDGPDLIDLRAHPAEGWRDLADDGRRFYADPFAIDHAGRTFLFVEDYPHATGKAVISAVAIDRYGPTGVPVPVLEEAYHLSYPFVFFRDGQHWMVPESCANGTVDLYRATAFPGGWVREATLVAGVTASDATLVEHSGRWWMFATVQDRASDPALVRGSYSDALHLWSAPDFRGPWTAHPKNPVLVDIASARPAGAIVMRGGSLIRPVQDGRRGYGEALALARIDRLDAEGYAQTVETTLRAGPGWPGNRLHTLNRSGDYEFIDGSRRSPRLP